MIETEWEQNSEQWIQERLGKPSASKFNMIVNQDGKRSGQRDKYMRELAGEIITGEQTKGFYNKAMADGHEREAESGNYYEITMGVELQKVGFCYKDEKKLFGASPDSLIINSDGGFETKNAQPTTQIARILDGWSGSEHHRQVQGCMLITSKKWWDLASYCRGMKQIVLRFERDQPFLEILEAELIMFSDDLHKLVAEIRG